MESAEAGTIGVVFFFTIFVGILIWTMLPKNNKRIEEQKNIPLREDQDD